MKLGCVNQIKKVTNLYMINYLYLKTKQKPSAFEEI